MTPRSTATTHRSRPTTTNYARRFRSYAGAATNVGIWMPPNLS